MSLLAIQLEEKYGAHNYHPIPIVFSRAKGIHVWDPEGKQFEPISNSLTARYMDFLSAYSAVNQGHSHPRIIKALVASKLTLSSRAFHNDVFGTFAKYITGLFGYDMVLPMNTGAEAVETAMKLARKWGYLKKGIESDKAMIVGCTGNFHGRTLAIAGMSNDESSRAGFGPFVERIGCVCPVSKQAVRYNSIKDLEACFNQHGPHIAGFLVEPIQAGIILPDDGYLAQCHALCKHHNILLIIDEIQTGLGRTGKLLAQDYDGVKADILILGKALSGGVYPVSAVLANEEIMLCIQPGEHGSTYGGNPLACAVSIAALQVLMDEELTLNAMKLGEVFRQAVRALGSELVVEVRGKGLLNAVVIDEKRCKGAWELCIKMAELGLLAKPTQGNIIRFAPPLCITEQEILAGVEIIGKALVDISLLDEVAF